MKERYIYLQVYWCKYKRYSVIICLIAVLLFLSISLLSFHKDDPSWCKYGLYAGQINNYAGLVGAYAASCMIYFFGAASWTLIFLLSFLFFIYAAQCALAAYKRKIGASVGIVLVSAVTCHLFFSNICQSYYAGGYVGYGITTILLNYITLLQCNLLIIALWLVCIVALSPCICRQVVLHLFAKMRSGCSYATCMRVYSIACDITWLLALPISWLYQAIIKCIEGEDDVVMQCHVLQDLFEQQKDIIEQKRIYESECEEQNELAVADDVHELETKPSGYMLPNLDIFIGNKDERDNQEVLHHLQERALLLEHKLQRFGITGKVVSIKRGPVVTLFEYEPHIDSKISKIIALEDDLALALQALSIRIIAPIPGKPYVGFEVSNTQRKSVSLAHVLRSDMFTHFDGFLPLAIGQDTIGNTVIVDLVRMPHLLIAGSTGSGKSVALNSMLVSLLCKLTPDQLRLILIDPKRLEFASYADIAHLLFPIITQPNKAAPVLKWVVQQMEERYELMAEKGARNIQDYNALMDARGQERLPFIVLIIDELADLMMTTGREIEDLIARIAQMARASGIHLIVATQRPSVDVITGLIKVNFPSRISFRVTSKVDSRTILDCGGADKLLGRGDMLFLDAQDACLKRLHGAYVSDAEIDQLVAHIKRQRQVQYISFDDLLSQTTENEEDQDELYQEVLAYLEHVDEISISLLQRKFRIGYNRSARIIEMLEMQGLIGPSGSGKTRTVIRT